MKQELCRLLEESFDVFNSEDALLRVSSSKALIVGDIHGNLEALEFILYIRKALKCDHIIFLGDYVDKGPHSSQVLERILTMKLREPDTFIMLRGNHETREMNRIHGFYDEILDEELFQNANRTFEEMPISAVLNDSIFCVHGGIPGPVDLKSINKEEAFPFLWNDPCGCDGMSASIRGSRPQCFGADIFSEFMDKNELSLMIRGHTALFTGYAWCFDRKLLSIFSCPEYIGKSNNASFALLNDNELSIFVFGRTGNCYSLLRNYF
ncbi:metallophosphoesterase [Methanolobus bombayensis]|uniref:metallophosphoesterase n=1 Tax=Methanolobus bombayensis TaxID=38023 RepID=UPI001AE6C147|nr:metallophosphoesterase [Methanolobus bombayensis]MBP1908524.1 serine/threonine-protein phosphatase PP1 catalytic subunit [Methanolobus bombayensis]